MAIRDNPEKTEQKHRQGQQYFHGSCLPGLHTLKPHALEHGMPLVYLTTNPVVAALYTVHPVERPYNWYPYGFSGSIPVYTEYYPQALKDVYGGKTGYIYRCRCEVELSLDNPTSIGCALVSRSPVEVKGYTALLDVYEALLEYERSGKLIVRRYETLSEKQKETGEKLVLGEIRTWKLREQPDCSYSRFLRERFPEIWEKA